MEGLAYWLKTSVIFFSGLAATILVVLVLLNVSMAMIMKWMIPLEMWKHYITEQQKRNTARGKRGNWLCKMGWHKRVNDASQNWPRIFCDRCNYVISDLREDADMPLWTIHARYNDKWGEIRDIRMEEIAHTRSEAKGKAIATLEGQGNTCVVILLTEEAGVKWKTWMIITSFRDVLYEKTKISFHKEVAFQVKAPDQEYARYVLHTQLSDLGATDIQINYTEEVK